jgi:hypothetical protein
MIIECFQSLTSAQTIILTMIVIYLEQADPAHQLAVS